MMTPIAHIAVCTQLDFIHRQLTATLDKHSKASLLEPLDNIHWPIMEPYSSMKFEIHKEPTDFWQMSREFARTFGHSAEVDYFMELTKQLKEHVEAHFDRQQEIANLEGQEEFAYELQNDSGYHQLLRKGA